MRIERMKKMNAEIRIYVADLAAYNAGILHGVWVGATLDLDEIQEQIDRLLKCSPVPNSEECAIHDFEGFEGVHIAEYESLGSVHEKALFIEEHGKLGAAVLENFGGNLEEATKSMEGRYQGVYESPADYARELTEQTGGIPKHLEFYIDYEKMASDMEDSGDIFTVEQGLQEVHVFWNH